VPITAQQKVLRWPEFRSCRDRDGRQRPAEVAGEVEFSSRQLHRQAGPDWYGLYVRWPVGRGSRLHELAQLGDGEFSGELAVADQQPRMASVQAETDVTCLALRRDLSLPETTPPCLNLIKGLTERLRCRASITAAGEGWLFRSRNSSTC
jgi:hypothetical protein